MNFFSKLVKKMKGKQQVDLREIEKIIYNAVEDCIGNINTEDIELEFDIDWNNRVYASSMDLGGCSLEDTITEAIIENIFDCNEDDEMVIKDKFLK